MADEPAGPTTEWDPDRYDDDHAFVFEYGESLVDLLAPEPGERVLDLGCGTGHLTADIAAEGANAVGVDSAPGMIDRARREHPDLSFARADARALPFDGDFDAVFSNAALHWIDADDQGATLAEIATALRPDGRLVAELGGAGNVDAVTDALLGALEARGYDAEHPWFFPTVGEYATLLERHGFEVRFARLFDRPTPLEGEDGLREWIDMFAEGLLEPCSPADREAVLSAVEDDLRPERYRDGRWIADYRRLRIVAHLA